MFTSAVAVLCLEEARGLLLNLIFLLKLVHVLRLNFLAQIARALHKFFVTLTRDFLLVLQEGGSAHFCLLSELPSELLSELFELASFFVNDALFVLFKHIVVLFLLLELVFLEEEVLLQFLLSASFCLDVKDDLLQLLFFL